MEYGQHDGKENWESKMEMVFVPLFDSAACMVCIKVSSAAVPAAGDCVSYGKNCLSGGCQAEKA